MLQSSYEAMSNDMRQKLMGYTHSLLSPHQKRAIAQDMHVQRAALEFQAVNSYSDLQKDDYERQRMEIREQHSKRRKS